MKKLPIGYSSFEKIYDEECVYQAELETLFADRLQGVELDALKLWYNGYDFGGNKNQKVYNPFDILLFFDNSCEYRLGFPNFEVRKSFNDSLSAYLIDNVWLHL